MSASSSKSARLLNVVWETLDQLAEEEGVPRNQLVEDAVILMLLGGGRDRPVAKEWRKMKSMEERDRVVEKICAKVRAGKKARGLLYNHAIVEALKKQDLRCSNCEAELRLGDVRGRVARELLKGLLEEK